MTAYDTGALDTAPARVTPHLLGLVGERFAIAISAAQAHLREGGAGALEGVEAELGEMERLGVQLQQVARMVGHEGLAPPEQVDLFAACGQALAAWQAHIEAAGLRVRLDGGPVRVELNAAALVQSLELLVEHAVAVGEQLTIRVAASGAPGPASVRFDLTRRRSETFDLSSEPSDLDELLPALASVLARGTGLLMRQTRMGHLSTLTLTVPMETPDLASSESEALLPRTPVAAGGRVLIVDPRASSRLKAHQLLHAAGMVVDAVENPVQALASLQDSEPEVLISGYPVHDRAMTELIDQIRANYPALRVIELVDEDNAFAFSLPGADAPGRLSRNELDARLSAAVSQEIFSSKLG
jgi:hypothetical protein